MNKSSIGHMVANSIREGADVVRRLGGKKFLSVSDDLEALAWIAENHPDVLNSAYKATKEGRL